MKIFGNTLLETPDPDDIIKNSLRICYRPYPRYQNFIKQIKNEGWHYVGDIQIYSRENTARWNM